jgi:starvation-inducible DNA-binding protein
MYFMAHSHHWNVEGVNFPQYHGFFGTLYEELHSAVDEIAEQLRAAGVKAPASLSALYSNNAVEDSGISDDLNQMINSLLDANTVVKNSLYACLKEATDMNRQGLVNFIADRITQHDKYEWMLKASSKGV